MVILNYGYNAISLKCIWSNGRRKNIFKKDDQCQEFIINNISYFTHQERTIREWRKDPKNIKWVK